MRKFVAQNGESITALNDIQAEAFLKVGLTEVLEPKVAESEVIEVPKLEMKASTRKKK